MNHPMNSFKVIGLRVLAKPIDEPMSDIVAIPGREKTFMGEVVQVGPGDIVKEYDKQTKKLIKSYFKPVELEVGDKILWEKAWGVEINVKGERLVIVREDTVLGVL